MGEVGHESQRSYTSFCLWSRDEVIIVLITSGTKFLSKGERQLTKKENSVPPLKDIMLPEREHREAQGSRHC